MEVQTSLTGVHRKEPTTMMKMTISVTRFRRNYATLAIFKSLLRNYLLVYFALGKNFETYFGQIEVYGQILENDLVTLMTMIPREHQLGFCRQRKLPYPTPPQAASFNYYDRLWLLLL